MKRIIAGILLAMMMVLYGCSGGGSGTAPDTSVKKAAVSGTVSFPALGSLVGKRVASTPPTPPVLTITDLSGAPVATVTLYGALDDINKLFTYSATLDSSKNYIFKASWGGQVLRALADKSSLSTLTADIKITPVSTATVLVVEQSLALTPGTLGTSGTTETVAQAASASLAALPPAAIETKINDAVTLCNSAGTVTAAQVELASLANIVEAVIKTKADAAVFMADTTATNTVTAVTYTQTGGTVTANSGTVAPADVVTIAGTITATLPKITSTGSATFTAGAAGSFTVTGIGTLSVTGTLPPGVAYDSASGLLSGTPAAGSNTSYPLTFTATSGGLSVTQAFTLTVNPSAVIPAPAVFTTAMISGKSFSYSDTAGFSGTPVFNANGTYVDTSITTGDGSGSWSINASGQLVIDGTETLTLSANTGTVITASAYSSSTQKTYTVTLTVVTPTALVTNITVADYAKAVGYLRYSAYPGISHTHYFDGVQTVSGRSVNVLRELDDAGSVLKETVYFSADITAGVYFLGANGAFFVNAFPTILPAFVPGQEYGPYDIMGDGSQMVYVTWTFENVTVTYGAFTNALKQKTRIRTGSVDTISYNWYVKDVGGVKWQDGTNAADNELLTERNFTWPNSGAVTAQW